MASNSLLECLVFAASCARAIKRSAAPIPRLAEEAAHPFFSLDSAGKPREDSRTVDDFIHQVRKIMWDHVGIVRSDIRLIKAKNDLQKLLQQINVVFPLQILSKSLIELRNVMTVAQLVVESALMRKESRGLHYNVDYPHPLAQARNTILHLNPSPTMSAIGEKQF